MKLEDVVIFLKSKDIKVIIGSKIINRKNSSPFKKNNIEFLSELSRNILTKKEFIKYTDLITFAFWCRKNNIISKVNELGSEKFRKGLGTILHIPPSNTPIALAYSFVFGLLSGNSNIVRISDVKLKNIELFLNLIKNLLKKKKFKEISKNNAFIFYNKETTVSNYLSKLVDGRIIWGGEKTVKVFKQMETKNSCRDIFFDDKYSISIIDYKKFELMSEKEKDKLIKNFYNDTFIMDQNACSSPHSIFWINRSKSKKNIFWKKLNELAKIKYQFSKEMQNLKYYRINKIAFNSKNLQESLNLERISVFKLKSLNTDLTNLRGFGGVFFENDIKKIDDLQNVINGKYQTITYFGVSKSKLTTFANKLETDGISRIVPIGQAIDMDIIWDGKNLVNELTRILEVK